jgi:thiol-disulfide isomerase/thioredoxin
VSHFPLYILFLFLFRTWLPGPYHESTTTRAGQSIPRIVVVNMNGDTLKTMDMQGKLVYVYFWSSWCNNCRKQSKQQIELYEKLRQRNMRTKKEVIFIAVSLDDSERLWRIAVSQDDLHWPNNVCDTKGWKSPIADAFGLRKIPSNFIYDTKGKLIKRNVWGNQLDSLLVKLNSLVPN